MQISFYSGINCFRGGRKQLNFSLSWVKSMKIISINFLFSMICLNFLFLQSSAQNKPNIVLIFPDNLGIGEVSAYGGVRGVPTPNIDKIGQDGIRLTNFNVEYSCTPSRIALLTGRYATRCGEDYYSGTTLWENTIAEHLKSAGYATALYGKWDIGGDNWKGKREPTNQGFDEWYGIPGTSHVSQYSTMKDFPTNQEIPHIWEGKFGKIAQKVKPFDIDARRTIDREAALKGVQFIRKNAELNKPFFLYYPMTQLHFPALTHPDKIFSTGAGDIGDAMADVDYNVGLILNELEQLRIDKNTIVIWCSDNGAELRRPWRGTSGPWRGYYNSAMEGGIRTPCVIRWPGHIPVGQVSNEMIHEVDLLPTVLAAVGIYIKPDDRILDGINQLPFLEGKQKTSDRKSALFINRNGDIMAAKWHDWKLWYNFKTELPDAEPDNLVRLFDLRADPREEIDVKDQYPWVIGVMDSIVKDYEESLVLFPRVSALANTADPYYPPAKGSGSPKPVYSRSDRNDLEMRSKAIPRPDFTGSWSTTELNTVSVINRIEKTKIPSLGSGWGDKISIRHQAEALEVERVFFNPRELQSILRYQYNLNGSESINDINMGRSGKPLKSVAKWKENRLEITTSFSFQHPESGQWHTSNLKQTIWLEDTTSPPWDPILVVETFRQGVLGSKAVVNRTQYTRGYR